MTEWEEYSKIEWINKEGSLKKPAWIFDTRSIINVEELKRQKLNYGELVVKQ